MANPLPNRTEELPDRKYYDPDSTENWADPLEAVIEEVSANSIVSGPDRSVFEPLDGQLYIPTAGGDWYLGNGSTWDALGIAEFMSHTGDTTNPHSVTASQADALPTSGGTVTGDTTFGSIDASSIANTRIIAPSVAGAFDTLGGALADLPSGGGVVYLAETCTETGNITIDSPTMILGQGSQWATPVPAHINLNGNQLHITSLGVSLQRLKLTNGNVVIGEHNVQGGRHHIDIQIQSATAGGVEFRGGHMESRYQITSNGADGDGITWNLDTDGLDYWNDNVCNFTVSSCVGDAYVMQGFGTGTADIHGNEIRGIRAEQIGGTAWTVNNQIDLKANFISGFGFHDSGVSVTPAVAKNNTLDVGRLVGGGTLEIGGPVRAPPSRRDLVDLGPDTAFWDNANAGGMTKSSASNIITHAGTDVLVAANTWQTIFDRINPVSVECGTIVGHNVEDVRVTWSDGTTSTIYKNQARGTDNAGNYFSAKAIPRLQSVTALEFFNNAGTSYEYGWDVSVVEY